MKLILFSTLGLFGAAALHAAETGFRATQHDGGVNVTIDGKPFASYVIDQANKPYLWPVYGPTGVPMTRAYPMQDNPSESKEQRDHPHHRGITFGHESSGLDSWKFPENLKELPDDEKFSGGGDSWHERLTFEEFMQNPKQTSAGKTRINMLASIRHKSFAETVSASDHALIVEVCEHLDGNGKRFLTEERRLTFRSTETTRLIDIDQDFAATDGDVHFDDRKDAGLSIRVPASMAVDSKKGGNIVNSDGLTDKAAWGKPAKWCDYNGPVEGSHLGVAFLNHPSSYRYPTPWHVRTYGLFTANPFAQKDYDKSKQDGSTRLAAGQHLKLRHRLILHTGDAAEAKIEAAFEKYAKEAK